MNWIVSSSFQIIMHCRWRQENTAEKLTVAQQRAMPDALTMSGPLGHFSVQSVHFMPQRPLPDPSTDPQRSRIKAVPSDIDKRPAVHH
jgi:hypothetical protein